MADPRIVWNSINLDFPEGLSSYKVGQRFFGGVNTSQGGITERVRMGCIDVIEIGLEGLQIVTHAAFRRGIDTFWESWGSQGKQYAFALDRNKTVNTTLSNNEAAAATVIELPSTSGIVAGQDYLIISADLTKRERVTVQSISVGVSVTIPSPGLLQAFSSGDTFRDPDYFPKVVADDQTRPFFDQPFNTWQAKHTMIEDRA